MTNYFVDPATGNDTTGTGLVGAPWLTTQGALNNIGGAVHGGAGQGATGDQINIKAGTADTLSLILSLATYGTPTAAKPLLFRGYTSAANDGGIGDINGNNSVGVISNASAGIWFQDMHLHNCGAATIVNLSAAGGSGLVHCEIDTTTGSGASGGAQNVLANCYLHDIGGASVITAFGQVFFNRVETLTKTPTQVLTTAAGGVYAFNTIAITGSGAAANGIVAGSTNLMVFGNSVWSNAGTGKGIFVNTSARTASVFSNIVEGFSGAGGVGIADSGAILLAYGLNFLFNNTSNTTLTGFPIINLGADTVTGSSNFNNPTGTPHDLSLSAAGITACNGQAYPGPYYGTPFTSYRAAGAIQPQSSGGGGGAMGLVGVGGGLIG